MIWENKLLFITFEGEFKKKVGYYVRQQNSWHMVLWTKEYYEKVQFFLQTKLGSTFRVTEREKGKRL